ncbi:hypothetical protein LX32DRAFT_645041 [Colletotrichum zoysiae]|uniref:Uncharacterized protein n=1 Tax=Colletotrichum zoysiae TaxID=1216348 RepID=A0AAD9H5R0_9PEZI|nr:hypothetical protein LX32DRAFT_645041 [Colletotrichum zoysiae]
MFLAFLALDLRWPGHASGLAFRLLRTERRTRSPPLGCEPKKRRRRSCADAVGLDLDQSSSDWSAPSTSTCT